MTSNDSNKLFRMDSSRRQWMRDIRRYIHSHPELSFQERNTARYIQEKLKELGIPSTGGLAGTGVVATLPGKDSSREAVALRADMDALPIVEETNLPFSSSAVGVMHACGHDGHVAMLLGAAALLSESPLPGPVKLIFQPAEEHGNGAQKLVEENVLEGVGAVFSGHIDTHIPVGVMTVDEGIVCAWADPFEIMLRGRSGHAARPHQAVDALVAAANLVMSTQTLISRGVDPNRAAVVTIGSIQAGTAQNIIAKDALLRGTVRSTHLQTRNSTLDGLRRMVESIASMYSVEAVIKFNDAIPAVENTASAVVTAVRACEKTDGVVKIQSQGAPSLGAEDFAFYQQQIPGCMVRFGASMGEGVGVSHSGTYNFDEEVLSIGAGWYANAAWQWLQERNAEKRGV